LLRERADMGILYGEDRITYDWAKQVLARRQVQATPPVAMVGYGYFTLVPGQERFQLKLMAGVLGAILVLIAIANLFLS
ncbi:MAG TPA: hypothetical protein VFG56_01750, partial [Candidatus Saccharimonadales bacterium]|nr:hypothetical protein [Candidatus Saccharimonadales bacterium]